MESLRAENEAITKYHFNKEQIAASLYLQLFLFFPPSKSEKNDVSLSVHFKLHCLSLGFISVLPRLGAGPWDIMSDL